MISGCSKKELESVNETSLIEKNGVYYTKDKQPYSGQVSSLYENGSIKVVKTYKYGRKKVEKYIFFTKRLYLWNLYYLNLL